MKESNYDIPIQALYSDTQDVRVTKKIAQEWLLMNESIIFKGNVHHFQIKDLGLGICAVKLSPKRFKTTCMVKEFCLDYFFEEQVFEEQVPFKK
jgi:hypothetical protein